MVPAPDPSEVSAESLAVFRGNSSTLANQYPRVIFTGVNTDFESDEEGALAYASTLLNGGTYQQASTCAQQAIRDGDSDDPDPASVPIEVTTRDKKTTQPPPKSEQPKK